jgi:hypothetical protein
MTTKIGMVADESGITSNNLPPHPPSRITKGFENIVSDFTGLIAQPLHNKSPHPFNRVHGYDPLSQCWD